MDWQTPIALLFVLLAGGMIARRIWRSWSGDGSKCGTACGNCLSNKSNSNAGPLVTLQGLHGPRDEDGTKRSS